MNHPWTAASLTGEASSLPRDEQVAILAMADAYGVPATLLAAIRLAENGRVERAFGVLSIVGCDTYGEQCRAAAETIRNNVARYTDLTKLSARNPDGSLTDGYLAFLANRYAPVGTANDPTRLNVNWLRNVRTVYRNSEVSPA